jgi:hypothetical protein
VMEVADAVVAVGAEIVVADRTRLLHQRPVLDLCNS